MSKKKPLPLTSDVYHFLLPLPGRPVFNVTVRTQPAQPFVDTVCNRIFAGNHWVKDTQV